MKVEVLQADAAKALQRFNEVFTLNNIALVLIWGSTGDAAKAKDRLTALLNANPVLGNVRGLVIPSPSIIPIHATLSFQTTIIATLVSFSRKTIENLAADEATKAHKLQAAILKLLVAL